MSYLSDSQYSGFLEEQIRSLEDSMAQAHTRKKLELWRRQYQVDRLVGRAAELLDSGEVRPSLLYLRCEADLQILGMLVQRHRLDGRSFRSFLAADELRGLCKPGYFSPFPVHWASEWRDDERAVVLTLSDERPFRDNGRDLGNDYLERFIDLDRLQRLRETVNADPDRITVLYPLYREIHTLSILARCVGRMDERLRSVALSPNPLLDADFDVSLVEPFFYLWPLIFRVIDPAVVHVNVGWGIQALALSAFLPDRRRTVVDFYEVLSFLPEAFFERTHSSAEQVRLAEAHFFRNYDHIMHLCSDETSDKLAQKYDNHGSIVSVTEYLQEPVYCSPPRNDGEIRLVYGGAMLATNSPTDFYYRPFLDAVRYYTRENLHLYIYNSPYLNGTGENGGLKEVVRSHGLANVHVCKPLRLEEFTRQIVEYDYGMFLLTARDLNAGDSYNYFMATKFLTYLQAGLPVLIDSGYRYMADLVERYNIGVVLHERDLENVPEILNHADLQSLKDNVVRFREEFSIEKGSEKVLKLYHEILEPDRPSAMRTVAAQRRRPPNRRCVSPVPDRGEAAAPKKARRHAVLGEMIEVMARRENRLYYRDQSARTMASLADLAEQFDPSVIVELGTLGGLSLRTWVSATERARICAVDLSFDTLRETLEFLPADLSRVTLLEQDILKTDFAKLWTSQDRVIFFVDAHDLPNVPIMRHVLETALPSLPEGSVVVVDDLWFSEERLTQDSARDFLEGRVLNEIDELQCFTGHFAPYHEGGSFMGFAEVLPLLEFVNRHGITLIHDRGGKHAFFVWRQAYLSQQCGPSDPALESDYCRGSVAHNPLESVPVAESHRQTMREIAALYRQRNIRGAADELSKALGRDPRDQGFSYGLAACLARGGMLSQARDVLACNLSESCHPRYRRLFDDLVRRMGAPESRPVDEPQPTSDRQGLTIFAMPKAFSGHNALIQKNAIRSWARLDPAPEILLFGEEPGIREMAQEVGATHIPEVGRNEFGTPLVDRLFEAAQDHAAHEVLAYVNADMILMPDFAQAVQQVQGRLEQFLLIGQRWDLSILEEIDFNAPRWRESLLTQVREQAMLHAECGLDYFVFRRGLWPQIPPFAIGRTAWDNWLVMDPHKRGIPVVDGTEFITAVHQDHDYGHVAGGRREAWNGEEAKRNRLLAGAIDDSAYAAGATWALRKEGQLVEVPPRDSEVGTAAYRVRRIAWLAKQAQWLMTRRQMELAACKWEELLTILDKMLASVRQGRTPVSLLGDGGARGSYVTACVSLAGCYVELGHIEQAVASYTRLLESSCIELSPAQREDLIRSRDRLLEGLSGNAPSSGCSLAAGREETEASEHGPSRRIALIVSIPERPEGLRGVIRDIEEQVDEIRILLNGYETAPDDLSDCRKVSKVQTSPGGEMYASGVWTLLEPEDEGYILILDDDIVYPADYVERMVAKIEKHERRAVMVVHGMDFCEPFVDCVRDRIVYRFEAGRSQDHAVDVGGVGTLAFHTSTIRPQMRDFPNPSFRDLWFAVLAARHEVPIVCVARAAHWLRSRETKGKQLWYLFGTEHWRELKNTIFRQNLLPLLDVRPQAGRVRRRTLRIFCITNGRSTFEYAVRSLTDSPDLQEQITVLSDMHFLDAMGRCMELCDTPYFLKVDDDFILHPQAIAYMRKKVLEYPRPEELGIYYCHLWEDWTSRIRESIKVYNMDALRKIGGFKADSLGKVDRTTIARLEEAGFKVVGDPSVVALHACGSWQEQLEYERLWSSMAGQSYQKPTHGAMKDYCGTKSLDQQYEMKSGFLESVNRQLDTPFHRFLAEAQTAHAVVATTEGIGPTGGRSLPAGSRPTGGMTIFAMPKAFSGHNALIQRNAIRSWAKLDPVPEILLFGDEPGIREMANEVGATHIPEVGRNEFGTPLVDRLFEAAQDHAAHEVLAYVNADMILMPDFAQAVQQVQGRLEQFLLIGQRWDLSILEEIDFNAPRWRESLLTQVREQAMLHAECGLDYFVFRTGLWPQIPPFAIGRTAWDNWLVMDPYKRGIPVVDGTAAITAVHQDHDYGHVSGGRHEAWNGMEAARNRSLAGPADYSGLTTGATWLLDRNGALAQTRQRQPRYISAAYRNERSEWLLQQAKELIARGARELAACKCEETLACLDGWLELRRLGCLSSEPVNYADIAGRYFAGHTLLAQCYMQMGRHEEVVATYSRLLANPIVQIPPAQRDAIQRVRDRLARQLEAGTKPGKPPADGVAETAGPKTDSARSGAARVAPPGTPAIVNADAINNRPQVTVVTVCRNVERYLKECLDSIRNQTMTGWELFLIDDGSTDGTRRVIEEYARRDERIRPYCFPDNRGPYVRRNFAIGRAAADFIVIQDADDIMSPEKLERLHREISRDDCLAMVGSLPRTFLEEFCGLEYTEVSDLSSDHETIVASCANWRAAISHGTAIIRKALFDTIGLYDENPFASDAFWSAKLALYAQVGAPVKMANIREALTLIRIHTGSQTQVLPIFDPRGRRMRYRHYCECKLRRIREKWRQQPRLDLAAELRDCRCADFLARFKAKVIEWEGETLSVHFLNDLLRGAVSSLRERAGVSCVVVLNGLGVMQPGIALQVKGFDLLKGMAFHVCGLHERGLTWVGREIENHDNPLAHKFLRDMQEQGPALDVLAWCEQNAADLELRLAGEERERVRVALV